MKNLKIKSISIYLLVIALVITFLPSCDHDAPSISDVYHDNNRTKNVQSENLGVVSPKVLARKDQRVVDLKTIVQKEVDKRGTPNYDAVSYVEYGNKGVTALILPFTSDGKLTSTSLISYFIGGKYSNSFYFEFSQSAGYHLAMSNNIDVAFSGNFDIFTKQGEVIRSSIIENGLEVNVEINREVSDDLDDLQECLEEEFSGLPWWLRISCGASLGGCVYAANPFACGFIVGCVGGLLYECLDELGYI